jgi:class 3 adenylate cyclase
MDDVRAVMDAVGSRRAAFYGLRGGGDEHLVRCDLSGANGGARHPQRLPAPNVGTGLPVGRTEEEYEREVERELQIFGPRERARESVRTLGAFNEEEVDAFLEMLRFGSSPGTLAALHRMNREIDIRHVLPAVRVPTLVLQGSEDRVVPIEVARYVASHIPTARLVEVPGIGHLAIGRSEPIAAEIEHFVTEVWESGGWEESEPDRALATVLFTDIVGSTAKAAELGDRRWRELLEEHHALIRRQLVRFRGRELDTAGDGFFASFDGPARAIRCACSITEAVRELGLEVRAGLHTGECELLDGKAGGIAVHIGARVAKKANAGEVLVSSTVKDLVAGSGLAFQERGSAELKGVPGEWRLYAVETDNGAL